MTSFLDPKGDEFTELVDANLPRVDLVGKGANGMPFLVAKSAAGNLMSPDAVRALLDGTDVAKSRSPKLAPAYNAQGELIGLVDPKNVRPLASLGDESGPASKMPASGAPGTASTVPVGVPAQSPHNETKNIDMAPAPADEVGTPTSGADVEKADVVTRVVVGLAQQFGLRDEAEVQIAATAVRKAVAAQQHPDLSEAAKALMAMHATRAAVGAIERHRAQRRPR